MDVVFKELSQAAFLSGADVEAESFYHFWFDHFGLRPFRLVSLEQRLFGLAELGRLVDAARKTQPHFMFPSVVNDIPQYVSFLGKRYRPYDSKVCSGLV
jgi:hypothetical protein